MKKTFPSLFRIAAMTLLLLICMKPRADAVYTPVTLTGFNHDVVANGTGLPTTSTTAAFDNLNYTLVAPDYKPNSSSAFPVYALPASNTINSLATSGLTYTLAPYAGSNSLKLTTNNSSGTLTLTNTTLIGNVYLLCAGGDGSPTGTVTINFVGGGSQVFTGQVFSDWFNNTGQAVQGIGRANRSTGVLDVGAGATNPRLYQKMFAISLVNYAKKIQSITITKTTATGSINVMAVTVDNQTCIPVQAPGAINITTNSATVKWNAVAGASSYQYAITSSATPPTTGFSTTVDTFYNATGLNVGTSYYLHVRNNCGAANSMWNSANFSTLACPSAGTPIITNNTPGTVTFEWPGSTVPGVTGYEYAISGTASTPSSGWTATTALSATVSSLTPGATYYAHVRGKCGAVNAPTLYVQFVNPFPPCDTILTPAVTDISMHGARITWHPSANGIGYNIEVSTDPLPPAIVSPTISDTTYLALGLTENTPYYVHIRTHCGTTNYSDWTSTLFTTTSICTPPANVNIANITTSAADITWNPTLGAAGYEYLLTQNPTPPTSAGTFVIYPVLAPLGLLSGTDYYLHLRVRCNSTAMSAWTTTTFSTVVGCEPPGVPTVGNITHEGAEFSWAGTAGAAQYEYSVNTSSVAPAFGITTPGTNITVQSLLPLTPYFFHIRSYCSSTNLSTWRSTNFTTMADPNSVPDINGHNRLFTIAPNPATDQFTFTVEGFPPGKTGQVQISNTTGNIVQKLDITDAVTIISISDLAPGIYHVRFICENETRIIRMLKQ